MALGRYVSDLEPGDILEPVAFTIAAGVARRFCHGFEEDAEWFHGTGLHARQLVPPTAVQTSKLRLLRRNCPEGDGPYPKLVTSYDATHHGAVPVDEPLVVSGRVVDRYQKRGREYLHLELALRLEADGRLLISYADHMLLRHQPGTAVEA